MAQLLQRWGCAVAPCASSTALAHTSPAAQLLVVDGAHSTPDAIAALLQPLAKPPAVIWLSTTQGDAASQQALQRGWSVLPLPARPAALRALVGQLLLRQR